MTFLLISGSNRKQSSNLALLEHMKDLLGAADCSYFNIDQLPAFHPDKQCEESPAAVAEWKAELLAAKALIVATPEYLHNIPAILKNSFEWLAASGELKGKLVVPMVFTPVAPRGEKAMESLLWTLKAMEAKLLWFLHMHHSDFGNTEGKLVFEGDGAELLEMTALQIKQACGL